jgi:ferrous iron transport protein B
MGQLAQMLDPVGLVLGMNGVILLAFILSLPANELLMPVILMILTGSGVLGSGELTEQLLLAAGWTTKTALCTMIFSVFHWPCATTLLTIRKETGSYAKTAAAFLLPTAVGGILCVMLNLLL